MRLAPFWRYYGGKFRAAPKYPAPLHRTIVEPFAGAAGYSLRYHDRDVILVEKYPVIAGIWKYLIGVSESEILRIPEVEDVEDLPSWAPQEAWWLVGFCMGDGRSTPGKKLSSGKKALRGMGRNYEGWCEARKKIIASQLRLIRHWRVIEGDFSAAPDVRATWFVDPPYQEAGAHYKLTLSDADYRRLSSWCMRRDGQIIVCENVGASWLPFEPWLDNKAGFGRGVSREALWYRSGDDMRETTLLEVMAEVGKLARDLSTNGDDAAAHVDVASVHAELARHGAGDGRRVALKATAARAILALHAHDAEAAKAGA